MNSLVREEAGRLVGIVSRADLFRSLVRPDKDIRVEVEDLLAHDPFVDLTKVGVHVHDGVVAVTGQLERRSLAPRMIRMIATVGGMVRVDHRLTFELDDTGVQPSSSNRQRL